MPTRQWLVGRVADLGLLYVQVAGLVGGALDVGRLLVSGSIEGGDRLMDNGLGSSSIVGLGGVAATNSARWVAGGVDASRGVAGIVSAVVSIVVVTTVVVSTVVVSGGRILSKTAVEVDASVSFNYK